MIKFLATFFPEHFSQADRMGVFAAILFAIISLVTLLRTSSPTRNKINKPIARLEAFSNNVRYKESGSVTFFDVTTHEDLQNKDDIFTGENSGVTVRFLHSKTVLKIPSSSLVKIEDGENGEAIEIKNGIVDIFIEKDHAINVKVEGVDHQITPGPKDSVVKAYYGQGELHFSTKDTGVKIKSAKKEYKLEKNRDAIFEGDKIKTDLNFILLSPTPGSTLDNVEAIKISTNKKAKYKVTISRNIDFIHPSYATQFDGTNFNLETKLDEGDYYLKVEDKKSSKIVPLTLTAKYKIDGFVPKNGEVLTLKPTEAVILRWNPQPVKSYKVIVRDHNGKENIYIAYTNEYTIENLKGTGFEWTVVAEVAQGKYSNVMSNNRVELKYSEKIELISPADKTKFKVSDQKINVVWKAYLNERFYVTAWDIKNHKTFFTQQTSEATVVVPIESNGPYKIEIASLDYPRTEKTELYYDVISPFLSWTSRPVEEIKSTEEIEDVALHYKLNFDPGTNANFYVKYSSVHGKPVERKFKITKNAKIKTDGFGQYCFRAKLTSAVEFYSDSEDYCLTLTQLPVFPTVLKAHDAVLTYAKTNGVETYKIEVPNINKAVKYQFEVYKDNQCKKLVHTTTSSTSAFSWATNRSGIYYLRYKVYDNRNRGSEFSPTSKFIFPISPTSDW